MARKILLATFCVVTLAVAHGNVSPRDYAPAAEEATVYVTKTGKKYHQNQCRYLDHSKRALNLSAAKKSYTPCKVCRPSG